MYLSAAAIGQHLLEQAPPPMISVTHGDTLMEETSVSLIFDPWKSAVQPKVNIAIAVRQLT